MASTRSIIAPPPFAANALTTIPPTPVAGVSYRDPVAGPASSPDGWPYAERVNSAEFNQIMYQISYLVSLVDKKGLLGWSSMAEYTEYALCLGSDGVTYKWVSPSGPSNGGAKDPTTDIARTYWDIAFTDAVSLATSAPFAFSQSVSMSTPVATASTNISIPSAVATVGPTGTAYRFTGLTKPVNLGIVGVGGMDTGAAPNNGFVATYLIFNPSIAVSASNPSTLTRDATALTVGETYGGSNMPSGYTASVLLGVYATNASGQFRAGSSQLGRKISFNPFAVTVSAVNQPTLIALSIAPAVPLNAKFASMTATAQTTVASLGVIQFASDLNNTDAQQVSCGQVTQIGFSARDIALITPQTVFRVNNFGAGVTAYTMSVVNYTF